MNHRSKRCTFSFKVGYQHQQKSIKRFERFEAVGDVKPREPRERGVPVGNRLSSQRLRGSAGSALSGGSRNERFRRFDG